MDEKIKACQFCGSAAKISKVNARFMKGRAKKKKYNIYYSIGCLPRKMRRERMSTINREEAIRWVQTECNPYGKPTLDYDSGVKVIEHLEKMRPAENHMPSAQPDVPDMNDGDMISRQVAMEMLMTQNVIMDGSEYHNGFNAGVNRAQEVIRNLSPVPPNHNAEVSKMEIIHCKDCKHWNLQVGNVKGDGLGSCDFHNVNLVTGEGFCYWADMRGGVDG